MSQVVRILSLEELSNVFWVSVDSDFNCNILKPDGTLFLQETFSYVSDFDEGICVVRKLDGKGYFLKEDGTFISDVEYYNVSPFVSGKATIRNENLHWNWILPNGELFFKKWVKKEIPDILTPRLHVIFKDDTTATYDERDNSVEYHNE